jgi:hypothetical protein
MVHPFLGPLLRVEMSRSYVARFSFNSAVCLRNQNSGTGDGHSVALDAELDATWSAHRPALLDQDRRPIANYAVKNEMACKRTTRRVS